MDFSSLPHYPPHEEPSPSQSDRLRESRGMDWEKWLLIALLIAAVAAASILLYVWALGRGAGGLAG